MELKRVIRWTVSNATIAGIFVMGTVYSAPGFRSMIPWVCSIYLVLSVFCCSSVECEKLIREKGRAVAAWIDVPFDVGIVFILAYYELPGLALVYLLYTLFFNDFTNALKEVKH